MHLLEPQVPIENLEREEYNAYRKTSLQRHIYEFIFQEAQEELPFADGFTTSAWGGETGTLSKALETLNFPDEYVAEEVHQNLIRLSSARKRGRKRYYLI